MDKDGHCLAKPIGFDGYCGYYAQNYSNYIEDDGQFHVVDYFTVMLNRFLQGKIGPQWDPVLRFGAVEVRPELRVKRGDDGFWISGPHYSAVVEAAKYMNYSLMGSHWSGQDMLYVAIKDGVQYVVSNINPTLKVTIDLCSGELLEKILGFPINLPGEKRPGAATHALAILEMDTIFQFAHKKPINPFRFLSAFEPITWIFIFLCGFLVALVLSADNLKSLWRKIEYVFNSIFGCPELKVTKAALGVCVLWSTVVWLLQQYYGGDMFSSLLEKERLDVMDTLEELANKPGKKILTAATEFYGNRSDETMKREYFQGYSYREGLISKTSLLHWGKDIQFEEDVTNLMNSIGDDRKSVVALFWRSVLEYVLANFGNFSDEVRGTGYISKGHGDSQPQFFLSTVYANSDLKRGVNYVILRLTESGIHQRWVKWATYGRKDLKLDVPAADYIDVGADRFGGPAILCSTLLSVAILALFGEKLASKADKIKHGAVLTWRALKRIAIYMAFRIRAIKRVIIELVNYLVWQAEEERVNPTA